jgi:hypothetical protein
MTILHYDVQRGTGRANGFTIVEETTIPEAHSGSRRAYGASAVVGTIANALQSAKSPNGWRAANSRAAMRATALLEARNDATKQQ